VATATDLDIPGRLYRAPRQDGGTRRMLLVAGGLLGAIVLAVFGLWAFASSGPRTVPVIEADARPIRVKPEDPGGMQVTGLNDQILSGAPSGPQPERLAPPPEMPVAPPMRRAEPSAPPSVQQAALTSPTEPAAPERTTLAGALPLPPVPPAPPSASSSAAPVAAAATSDAAAEVQLGALRTEQSARAEWNRLIRRVPELFRGRQPVITKLERNGQTLYRLRTGGFADTGAAKSFCDQAKTRGVACIPAT